MFKPVTFIVTFFSIIIGSQRLAVPVVVTEISCIENTETPASKISLKNEFVTISISEKGALLNRYEISLPREKKVRFATANNIFALHYIGVESSRNLRLAKFSFNKLHTQRDVIAAANCWAIAKGEKHPITIKKRFRLTARDFKLNYSFLIENRSSTPLFFDKLFFVFNGNLLPQPQISDSHFYDISTVFVVKDGNLKYLGNKVLNLPTLTSKQPFDFEGSADLYGQTHDFMAILIRPLFKTKALKFFAIQKPSNLKDIDEVGELHLSKVAFPLDEQQTQKFDFEIYVGPRFTNFIKKHSSFLIKTKSLNDKLNAPGVSADEFETIFKLGKEIWNSDK